MYNFILLNLDTWRFFKFSEAFCLAGFYCLLILHQVCFFIKVYMVLIT